MHPIRVRALSNVLGLHRGDVVDVLPTPRVEVLIRGAHLEWLDDPSRPENAVEPVLEDASVNDEPVVIEKPRAKSRKVADDE